MAEIDDLIKDIDDVLGNKEEPQTKEVEVKDETDELISEIESVLSPQQPAEEKPKEEIPQAVTPEKPKEELPKAVPSALPAPTPVKEPEVDLSKPSNIVLSVIGDKDEAEFTPADRDLIKSLDAADLNEFTKGRPDVFLDDDQERQIFNYQRELRKSSPYAKIPSNWEEWYNLGAAASEDLADVGVMTADLLGSVLKGGAKAVEYGAPALLGMTSEYAEALAAEKLLPEDKKAEIENWRKRAWQIANTPVKGGEEQNPDAYTDAKYLAKIKENLTPEQIAGIEKDFAEKRLKAKQVPFSYTSELASLPESVAFTATKVASGGMQLWDNASEKFGLQDEETSFQRYKARREVDTAQAKLSKAEPRTWARVMDTYYAPVLKSFSSLIHPSVKEYMIMYPELSSYEAASKREADIENNVIAVVDDVKKSIPETDPNMAAFGSVTIPGQFGVDVFGYAYSVVQASKMLTPIAKLQFKKLGLSDDQINNLEKTAQEVLKKKELSRLEGLQKPGLIERAAGATARGIEKTGDYLERSQTWQAITRAAPAVTGATIGYQVNPENPFAGLGLGALGGVGAKYGVKTLVDVPKVIKEVQAARRISAGGSAGPLATLKSIAKQQDEVKTLTTKLKTLAEGTDEYIETKKALDVAKSRVKDEGIVDYEGIGRVSDTTKRILRFVGDDTIANIGEYARLGIEPTLVGLATGIIDSSDEEELKTMIAQGLVFSLGGRAVQQGYHKFVGEDPVIQMRKAKQANMDALKAYRDSTPETRGEIDKLTDWDLVINRQAKKVADTEAEVQRLVNESPDNKKIEEAEKRLEAEKKSLSLLKTANVQTRNEFGRQFLNQLGRNNALLNGTLRAGQNNVGINILTTQQIFDHFRKNPQWQNVPDEVLMEYASQQGFYSGTGGTEFRPGVNVSDAARSMTFDPAKPSIVINSDALRDRIELFGETPIDALNHETGHAILRIKEIQDAVADASKLLFTNEITDASGNVKEITTGLYSEEQLNSLFKDQYLKNRSKDEIARLGTGLGLWDANTNSLNKKKVANYMQEEILAELFSNTLSRNLGKNIDSKQVHLIDIARLKLKNKLFKNAVTKMLGFGMDGDVFSKATGATLTPDAQSASRNALRILESINGDITTIAEQPETAPISKADIRKSKIAAERYGMDSGLFATKVQAQVFDANGNPVGDAVDVTDPSVFEGSWRISKDGEERLSGYGQIPLELRQLQVPEGGTLSIKKKIITEVDGVTPKLLKPSDLRKIKKDRAELFKQAIDTPDYGTPGRFEPVSEGSESYRGTFTPAQIKAIQELPEGIVPLKIKKYLLELNEAIVRRDGTRFFVDYAAVMDDNGNYKAFSPKIYDVVPIGLQLSTAGNFLVTTISVGRMMSKLNAWSDRMPNRLSPWNGSKEAFWNEFSTKYLDNWSKGIQGSGYNERGEAIGSNQLSDDVAVAEQKKSIFNDFLNLFKNETEVLNLDRTKIPKRKGDEKNKSIDRTIMSMRIDHMAELLDAQDLPKLPIDYGKAIINFLPAETAEIEAPSGERGFKSKLQMEIQRNFKGAKATPEQMKAVLNNPQNVKAEEVKWSGVNDAIDRLASENNGKVPVQELLNYLRDEGQVKFEEVTLGGKEPFDANRLAELEAEYKNLKDHPVDDPSFGEEKYDELIRLMNIRDQSTTDTLYEEAERVMRLAQQAQRRGDKKTAEKYFRENEFLNTRAEKLDLQGEGLANPPKFASLVLPGGENYREVVMAMPEKSELSYLISKKDGSGLIKTFDTEKEAKDFYNNLENKNEYEIQSFTQPKDVKYTSSHFPDIPNYVAHMRLNERTDAEGNDGLFVEEFQSDRHQAGRERGYEGDIKPISAEENKRLSQLTRELFELEYNGIDESNPTQEFIELNREYTELSNRSEKYIKSNVPDAPFRKDWSLQLFKRALRDAVESGKKWIGWTTGIEQVKRYENQFRQAVDEITWNQPKGDPRKNFAATKNGRTVITGKIKEDGTVYDSTIPDANEMPLSEVVGKSVAAKILAENSGTAKGNDLTIGGEGMKGFYDTIVPKEIGKYVDKMGGRVEKSKLADGGGLRIEKDGASFVVVASDGTTLGAYETREQADARIFELDGVKPSTPIWRVNITPQMENVVRAGQLQFMPAEVDARYIDLEAKAKSGDKRAAAEAQRMVYEAAKAVDALPKVQIVDYYGEPKYTVLFDGEEQTSRYMDRNGKRPLPVQNRDTAEEIALEIFEQHKEDFDTFDTFTYDDAGALIPLSERFQSATPDIRFMPAEQPTKYEPISPRIRPLEGISAPTKVVEAKAPALREIEPPVRAKAMLPDMELEPTISEKPQSSEMIGDKSKQQISIDDFKKQLEKQQTLDLEEDQVSIPKFNDKTDNFVDTLISGKAHLMVRNKEDVSEYGPHEFFILDNNDNPIGFSRLTKTPKEVSINLIKINEDYRGQGIGSKFYKYWLDKGLSVKSDKEITNDTQALYSSLARQGYGYDIENDRAILKPTISEKPIQSSDIITSAKPAPDAVIKPFSNALVSSAGLINFLPAYHGTPFEVDKFSTAKIGTGEGAQAYGWGLYFAQAKAVGEGYRDQLGGIRLITADGQMADNIVSTPGAKKILKEARAFWKQTKSLDGFVKQLESSKSQSKVWAAQGYNVESNSQYVKDVDEVLSVIKDTTPTPTGNLYKVDLDVKDEDLLDWDKPLSEQSEKLKAVNKALQAVTGQKEYFQAWAENLTGSWLYHATAKIISSATSKTEDFSRTASTNEFKLASEALAKVGIPGIRYLDGTSRKQGEGTYNYVVFDENLIKILDKNDKPVKDELPRSTGLQFLPQQIEEKIIETAVKNKDGSIISYPNKNHAMIMEETDYNLDAGEFPPMENFGFITNTGRFVNQKEAQEIAKKSKQVEGNQQISGELVSRQNIAFLPEQIDSSTSVKSLTENENYKDAKYNGNPMFAYNLAKKFLTDEVIASVNSKINPEEPAIIIPVSAIEGEDLNTIPLAVADILSWKLNIPVSVDIVKTSKQHNTGASAQDRASNIHSWAGKKPKEGTQIILVDDTYTTGQTLRSLADYVGEPTAIVTLASGRYGKKFDLPIELEKKLLDKAGITKEDFISNYGKEPNAVLTGAQAQQYLLNGAKGKEGLFSRFPSRLGKAKTRSDSQLQDAGRNRRVDTEEYIGLNFLPSDKDSEYAKQLEFAFPKGPKTLTYFSGIGTWEQGLKGEIDPQYAVEYDPAKAAAYRAANGDHMIEGDVTQIDPKRFIGIEYFHASPVCKNYSLLKDPTRGGEESDLDIRSADAVNRVLETCKPKFFTLENVGGYKKSDAYASIKKTLTDLGYKFDEAIYKANEYGSPTDRKRLLLRATLSGELPTPIKKQGGNWYDTIEDIVNDLPDAPLKGANFIWRELNKVGIDPKNVPYPILIAGGGSFQQVPWRSPDEPAYTFTTNQNNLDRILLPGGISKRVTGRAKARMSGFSDDFILPDNDRLANIVIGNGVPPDLVKNVIGPMFENK
jgi:site-specific DNA-cytosine methylase